MSNDWQSYFIFLLVATGFIVVPIVIVVSFTSPVDGNRRSHYIECEQRGGVVIVEKYEFTCISRDAIIEIGD
jgi:hypothetical protein